MVVWPIENTNNLINTMLFQTTKHFGSLKISFKNCLNCVFTQLYWLHPFLYRDVQLVSFCLHQCSCTTFYQVASCSNSTLLNWQYATLRRQDEGGQHRYVANSHVRHSNLRPNHLNISHRAFDFNCALFHTWLELIVKLNKKTDTP